MSDAYCPYCDKPQEICHDDGYGYEEGTKHNQQCSDCEKTFVYITTITFSYDTEQAECLNGAEHNWKPTHTYPREYTRLECLQCGEEKRPTDCEKEKWDIPPYKKQETK